MKSLRFYLFGEGCNVYGRCDGNKDGAVSVAVFAFLLLYKKQSHSQDTLATVFWNEQTERRAKRCLSTALWRLRR